jgi:hypothetical protein
MVPSPQHPTPAEPCSAWSQARFAALAREGRAPDWLAHLEECPVCARDHQADQRVLKALSSLESLSAPAGLDARVRGAIEGERRVRRALGSLEPVPAPAALDEAVRAAVDDAAQRSRLQRRWSLALGLAGAAAAVLVLARVQPAQEGRHWSFEVLRGDGVETLDPEVRALVQQVSGGALPLGGSSR